MPLFADSDLAAPAPVTLPAARVRTVVRADAKTGRLVRKVIVPPAAKPSSRIAPEQLTALVDRIASQQGVEVPLVQSVILAESNYDPTAVSPKGAQGIMQLIPATARRFGVNDTFNVADNIQGGVRYLRFLLDYYHDDYTKSIAAYNAGEAAVDKYNGIPPFPETMGYVRTVAKNLTAARKNQAKAKPSQSAISPEPDPSVMHQHIQAELGSDGTIYYTTP